MIDEQTIYKLAVDAGLSYFADDIVKLIKPAIGIRLHPAYESAIENGASKFGGLPHLPLHISWPTWEGVPLSFLAQINLAETTALDSEHVLPETGILYFFSDVWQNSDFDINTPGAWRVIYYSGNVSSVGRTPAPDNLALAALYEACSVEYRHELTMPYGGIHGTRQLRQLGFTEKDEEQYFWEVWSKLGDLYSEEDQPFFYHHLLGWHGTVQTDLQLRSEINSEGLSWDTEIAASKLDAWRLLLQIGADANLNYYIDEIRYFMIRDNDLQSRNFDNVSYEAQFD